MELIATESRSISITPQGTWTPATGGPTYVEIKATKNTLSGGKSLLSTISWTITGCTAPGGFLGGGGGSISATAAKCKMETMKPMRENDEGDCSGSLINSGTGATIPCSCKYKIASAGQTKAKAG